jgi:hypothetical protein
MSESSQISNPGPLASEPPKIPLLTPANLAIEPGQQLDGPSKTVVSDLINAHGFVLFRGYDIKSDSDFHRFIESFRLDNFNRRKLSPARVRMGSRGGTDSVGARTEASLRVRSWQNGFLHKRSASRSCARSAAMPSPTPTATATGNFPLSTPAVGFAGPA